MNIRICDYCGEKKNLKIIKLTHRPNDENLYAEICTQCISEIYHFAEDYLVILPKT